MWAPELRVGAVLLLLPSLILLTLFFLFLENQKASRVAVDFPWVHIIARVPLRKRTTSDVNSSKTFLLCVNLAFASYRSDRSDQKAHWASA